MTSRDYVNQRSAVGKVTRVPITTVNDPEETLPYHLATINDQDRRHLWSVLQREALHEGSGGQRRASLSVLVDLAQLVVMVCTLLGVIYVVVHG